MSMLFQPANPTAMQAKTFTMNLAQAAANYILCTVSGGNITIDPSQVGMLVTTAGATFTSVDLNAYVVGGAAGIEFLSAVNGAVANITLGKNLDGNVAFNKGVILVTGDTFVYTITGATGTGAIAVSIPFQALSEGAKLV